MDKQLFDCKHCKTRFKHKINLEKHVKLNHSSEAVDTVIDKHNRVINGKNDIKNEDYINHSNETCLSNSLKRKNDSQNDINERNSDISEYNSNLDAFDSFTDDYSNSSDIQTTVKSKKRKTKRTIKSKPPKNKSTKRRDNDSDKPLSVFVCNVCNSKFERLGQLKKHVEQIHEDTKTVTRPFKCNQCTSDFIEADYLRKHIYGVHGEKKFACDWENCEYKTSVLNKLTLHKQRHMNNKSNVCCWPGCDERFACKKDLAAHVRNWHTRGTDTQFPQEAGFQCTICEQILTTKKFLDLHIMAKHTNERPFACDKCDKSFVSDQTRKKHNRIVHEVKKFKCNDCTFRAFDRRDLDTHVRRVHLREKTVSCEFPECKEKLFFNLKCLKEHYKNKHSDVRPFVCDWPECGATFKYKVGLTKHVNQHLRK